MFFCYSCITMRIITTLSLLGFVLIVSSTLPLVIKTMNDRRADNDLDKLRFEKIEVYLDNIHQR